MSQHVPDTHARTVVVGVDHSESSRRALEWALLTFGPSDRIIAVHAWDLPVVAGYDVAAVIDPAEIGMAANTGLAAMLGEIDDPRLVPMVRHGHAGREIVACAVEHDADLVVVGPIGHGRLSMMLGSVASYVLHHAPRPVAVFRGELVAAPDTVLVGVDDHDLDDEHPENESVRALRWAYGIPGVQRIDVVHSWYLPPLVMGTFGVAVEIEPMEDAALEVVDHVLEIAGPPPEHVELERRAIRGSPGYALVDESARFALTVVGSRGRGGFSELLLGSTSSVVASHAHGPVVVVR